MTSEQVLLTLMTMTLGVGGCSGLDKPDSAMTAGIYPRRQLWAVVPLINESGSLNVDGTRFADHLANQFENHPGIDTVPVNRVLAAMDEIGVSQVTSPVQLLGLRRTLAVDGLIVGTINAYDPYDPPKLGVMIELYVDPALPWFSDPESIRRLTWAGVDDQTRPLELLSASRSPVSVVSGYFDAADPLTRERLMHYGIKRGVTPHDEHAWRFYRINMDLYTEFVAHIVSSKLMEAEARRLVPPQLAENKPGS